MNDATPAEGAKLNIRSCQRLLATSLLAVTFTAACAEDRTVQLPEADDATLRALLERTEEQMVFVKGGRFTMGEEQSTATYEDGAQQTGYYACSVSQGEANTHPVELDSYHINAYETTYGEQDVWAAFTSSEPVRPESALSASRTPDRPTGTRTWHEAKDYCTWLGEITGLEFDLPTEAQWEYAARSRGKKVPFATANGQWKDPDTFKNENWKDDPQYLGGYEDSHNVTLPATPLPVGTFPPNALGLYDMTGNVHEWVNDWYERDYYKRSPIENPQGPESGEKKILRGGAHEQTAYCNTVYDRYPQEPVEEPINFGSIEPTETGYVNRGFRCALYLDRPLEEGELVKRARERGHLDNEDLPVDTDPAWTRTR